MSISPNPPVIVHSEGAIAGVGYGEQGYLAVHTEDWTPDELGGERQVWHWKILNESFRVIGESTSAADAILTGVNKAEDPLAILESFTTFLLAAVEAGDDPESENYNLFTPEIREWALQNSGEIESLNLEINEITKENFFI